MASGHWPLFRFDPTHAQPRHESRSGSTRTRPRISLEDYRYREVRFKVVEQTHPGEARRMLHQAQLAVEERYQLYEDLAARDGSRFLPHWENAADHEPRRPATWD